MNGPYTFTPSQADYLRRLAGGLRPVPVCGTGLPTSVSLRDRMPPVVEQALRGTCVAAAVTALVEYYEDCRAKLSVQFLFEVTRGIEQESVERNLAALAEGRPLDPRFEAALHQQLTQLRLLVEANGAGTPAAKAMTARFADDIRGRFAETSGTLLRSCFRAVETDGVCRDTLWPYARVTADAAPAAAGTFPPGAREDALKHRVRDPFYLLRAPNNVDEIRGILAGVNGRRPMPVVATVRLFEGCTDTVFALPDVETPLDGRARSAQPTTGLHGVLLVGYTDDPSFPGGGAFLVRNSWGTGWGDEGYGRIPYAYYECFASEAGTILQDMVDYAGDGYAASRRTAERTRLPRFWRILLINSLAALAVAALTLAITWLAVSAGT